MTQNATLYNPTLRFGEARTRFGAYLVSSGSLATPTEYPDPEISVVPVSGSIIQPDTVLRVTIEFFRPVSGIFLVALFNNQYGDAPGEAIYLEGYGFFGLYQSSSVEEDSGDTTTRTFLLTRDGGWPPSDTPAQFKVGAHDSNGGAS